MDSGVGVKLKPCIGWVPTSFLEYLMEKLGVIKLQG